MTGRRRKRTLALLFRTGVTAGLCLWWASRADVSRATDCLRSARWGYVVAAAVTCSLVMLLHSFKWCLIIRRRGAHLPFARAVRATWGGVFVNHLLPGRLGGDVLRAYVARDATDGVAAGLGMLVVDRLSNLVAMLLTAALVARQTRLPVAVQWTLVGVGLGVIPALFVLTRIRPDAIERRFGHVAIIRQTCRLVRVVQQGICDPLLFMPLVALGVGVMALVTLVNVLAGRALGMEVNYFTFWSVSTIANTVSLLPISLGGVGVREGVFAYLFESAGATLEQGLVLSLLTRVIVMAYSLPGGLWLLMTESVPRAGGDEMLDEDVARPSGDVA